MSKKKNKKFKSHHREPERQLSSVVNVSSSMQSENIDAAATPEIVAKEEPTDEIAELNKKYAYVRRDVGKLLIVLSSLAILFVAIYFLGIKTDYLTVVGNWIYKLGHFSI